MSVDAGAVHDGNVVPDPSHTTTSSSVQSTGRSGLGLLLAVPKGEQVTKGRLGTTTPTGILAFVFLFVAIIGAGAETALKGCPALLLGVPVYVWPQRHPR
jgi:hypothetical protein